MTPDTPPAENAAASQESTKGTEKKPTRAKSTKGTELKSIHDTRGKRVEVGEPVPDDLTKEQVERLTRLGCIET